LSKLVIILIIFNFNLAFANLCEPVSEYKKIKGNVYRYAKPMDRVNASNYLSFITKKTAKNIHEGYRSGSLESNFFNTCISQNKDAQLMDAVSATFKKNLLQDFSKSSIRSLKILGNKYLNSSELFILQARLELPHKSDSAAGFYRMSGAMYYMLPEIHHNEFKIIALHELLHKFDEEELYRSSSEYSDKKIMAAIWDLAQVSNSYFALSDANQELVYQYALNALKRGFLAEFKAWAATYEIYKKMKQKNEITPIAWIEDILSQQGQRNYLDFVFDYYAIRFERPEQKSLFRFSLLQNAYDVVLKDLRQKNKCNLMDDLSQLIDHCH